MMQETDEMKNARVRETIMGRALLLLFGLGALGFLVAIDQPNWFAIRPATGTSLAMAHAASGTANQIAAEPVTDRR